MIIIMTMVVGDDDDDVQKCDWRTMMIMMNGNDEYINLSMNIQN